MAKIVVMIGSAHIDENGNARGGKAGDQTGKELSTQKWYKHDKGWVVIRAKEATVREKIAAAMEAACANKLIGYDQGQRDTLHTAARKVGFDPSKVTVACETDCSALVRVCVAYAGIDVASFRTTDEVKKLVATGQFASTTSAKYCDVPDRLLRGDILCTRTQGHTVVVLNDGPAVAELEEPEEEKPVLRKKAATLKQTTVLLAQPPTQADDCAVIGGQKVTVWGTSVANPDYSAVQVDHSGRKGYVPTEMLEFEK